MARPVQFLGCGDNGDCDPGEVCLDQFHTPAAGPTRMGIRQLFLASDADGYFVLNDRSVHTIINTSDDAFFTSYPGMRAEGAATVVPVSVHDALVQFLLNGPSPATRLMQDP